MKALVCLKCSTIRSPRADKSWTHCDCGQSGIRWVDPEQGVAEMWAVEPFYVRLLGLHNSILSHPQIVGSSMPDATWRHMHEVVCQHDSDGYLFHADRRNCWAVVTWPGESSDVTFRAEPTLSGSAKAAPQAPAEPTATPHGLIDATHVVNLHRSTHCTGCNAADQWWCSCPEGYTPSTESAAREDAATPDDETVTLDDLSGPECGKTGRTSDVGCDGTCEACTPDDDYGDDIRPPGPLAPIRHEEE